MLNGYANSKKIYQAEKLFNQMIKVGISPDRISYNIMIKIYAETGNFKQGMDLIDKEKDIPILFDLVHNRFDPLLKLPPVFGSGYHKSKI